MEALTIFSFENHGGRPTKKKSSAKVRFKYSSVKMRFSKNTNEPTIFDVTTTVKHDDVSMKIIKISPSLCQKIELQKTSSKKLPKM